MTRLLYSEPRLASNNWREAFIWNILRGSYMIEYSQLHGSLWNKYIKNQTNPNVIKINHMNFVGQGCLYCRINDDSILCVEYYGNTTSIIDDYSSFSLPVSKDIIQQINNGFIKYANFFHFDREGATAGLQLSKISSCAFSFDTSSSKLDIKSIVDHLGDKNA